MYIEVALLVSALLATEATAQPQPDLASEVRIFKTELWPRTYANSDSALLSQLLAPEFQAIDAQGVVSTRDQEISCLRTKPRDVPGRTLRYDIQRLDILPNGTAIVAGVGHVREPERAAVHAHSPTPRPTFSSAETAAGKLSLRICPVSRAHLEP